MDVKDMEQNNFNYDRTLCVKSTQDMNKLDIFMKIQEMYPCTINVKQESKNSFIVNFIDKRICDDVFKYGIKNLIITRYIPSLNPEVPKYHIKFYSESHVTKEMLLEALKKLFDIKEMIVNYYKYGHYGICVFQILNSVDRKNFTYNNIEFTKINPIYFKSKKVDYVEVYSEQGDLSFNITNGPGNEKFYPSPYIPKA